MNGQWVAINTKLETLIADVTISASISRPRIYLSNETSDITVTVDVGGFYEVGQVLTFRQRNTGKIIIAAGSGLTIESNTSGSNETIDQGDSCELMLIDSSTAIFI